MVGRSCEEREPASNVVSAAVRQTVFTVSHERLRVTQKNDALPKGG